MRSFATLASVLFLVACSSSSSGDKDSGTTLDSGTKPDAGATDGGCITGDGGSYCPCGYTLTPFLTATATTHTFSKADQVLDSTKDYLAVIDTDVGRIVMHLLASDTPITCNSFIFLTLNHFFDGIAFHRVINNFVAQGGDPNTLGTDRSSWGTGGPGYSFGLEVKPSLTFDAAGVVGMANAGPNDNESQFFITLVAYPSLNGQYTVFAELTEGLDVLPLIARGSPPPTPTRMTDVHICQQ